MEIKPIAIGPSDYDYVSSDCYYVDKTLLIKELIDVGPCVTLFTRPRRFGKTLNMNMLRTFFEKTDEDTSIFFRDKKIWTCGERYRREQGKYPVIYLSLKNVEGQDWNFAYNGLLNALKVEFKRQKRRMDLNRLSAADRAFMEDMSDAPRLDRALAETLVPYSLQSLAEILHDYAGTRVIILIDEYDHPIQESYIHGYYDKMIGFMRTFLSSVLKDNPDLHFGCLTGILWVAKASIFSGLNNLYTSTVLDKRYSAFFGYTAEEVQAMAAYYGAEDRYKELCHWYEGYRFGATEIFNPWSVNNYFFNFCEAQAYWRDTSSNGIIKEVLDFSQDAIARDMAALVNGQQISADVDMQLVYPNLKSTPDSIWTFLLMTGYLTLSEEQPEGHASDARNVEIPNREIQSVFSDEIMRKVKAAIGDNRMNDAVQALAEGNPVQLREVLECILMGSASVHDTTAEGFYHGLLLGTSLLLRKDYRVVSNAESGCGRPDLLMRPRRGGIPGIIVEIKSARSHEKMEPYELAEEALGQIDDRGYTAALRAEGVHRILTYGIGFRGKKVEVLLKEEHLTD